MLETAIEPRMLRRVLGRFATGVVVVTMRADEGLPVGMTVNSFSSVSLEPPIISFCASRASQLHQLFTSAAGFAVNILAESQKELSLRFARPGLDRFGTLEHEFGQSGVPVLPGALAVIECTTVNIVAAGDHDIVLGEVIALIAEAETAQHPLVFFNGAYRHLDPQHTDWWTAFS